MSKRGLTKMSVLCFKDLKDFKDFKVVRVLRSAPPIPAASTLSLYPLRKLNAAQPSR